MRAFISGVTGTLGTVVSKKLLDRGHEVIGYSRCELKQQQFPRHQNLTLYLGDLRDRDRVIEASRKCDIIFHFGALKHVDKLEENPEEAIQTNIGGTQNVLHAQRVNGIPRVVLASTDKSAYPINVYGMSKGIAERLVLRNPNNVVCRYGNVCNSRGSVIGRFIESLTSKSPCVYLTDENMMRFWITQNDAADFVLGNAFKEGVGGLRTPTMKAAPVAHIVEVLANLLKVRSYSIIKVPIRPGEKLSECLRTEYEGQELHSHTASKFTDSELKQMLEPIVRELHG